MNYRSSVYSQVGRPHAKTCLVAGATGLTGNELVKQLISDSSYGHIKLMVRRDTHLPLPDKAEVIVMDFDRMEQHGDSLTADDVYCMLGTTMKKAGSRSTFRKVDYEYPLRLARLAQSNGVNKFLIVTAVGANINSMFFYQRIKGELEQALIGLGIPQLYIFRPSLLRGLRQERRPGETMAAWALKLFHPLLTGPLKRFRPIEARAVAHVMRYVAQHYNSRLCVFESDRIQEIFHQTQHL